jgi:hydroxymethylbilane synthase
MGDRLHDVPLTQIGGDGVFVTEIEHALTEHRVDLAVHSLKDLPTVQPDGLRIFVIGPREDVRDVLVSRSAMNGRATTDPLLAMEDTARIGTSSLRRMAQLRTQHPNIQILPLRGNVDTRLRKLDDGEYDGIVLAAAGLLRMAIQPQLAGRISYLPIETMLPAPGQGALALEIRDEPAMRALLAPLRDPIVQATTSAERMFMRHLGAGCYLPVAAHGVIEGDTLTLFGLVISLDGQQQVRVRQYMPWTAETTIEHVEQLGVKLAEQALAEDAGNIIQSMNIMRTQERQHV